MKLVPGNWFYSPGPVQHKKRRTMARKFFSWSTVVTLVASSPSPLTYMHACLLLWVVHVDNLISDERRFRDIIYTTIYKSRINCKPHWYSTIISTNIAQEKPPIHSSSRVWFSANRHTRTLHKHGNAQLLTLIDLRAYYVCVYKHMISDWFQTHMYRWGCDGFSSVLYISFKAIWWNGKARKEDQQTRQSLFVDTVVPVFSYLMLPDF